MHVDGVVIGRAAELALLGRGRIAQRHAQATPDAQVRPDRAHHATVAIRLLDDASGHRAGGLTDRTRKRAEATVGIDNRYRLGRLLTRAAHHLGPHCEVIISDGRAGSERSEIYNLLS